jgi:fatty acid desaturase
MNPSYPLPPALFGDKSQLSGQARADIQALIGPKPVAFLLQAFGAWAVIVGVIALAVHIHQLWMTLLAIAIVATRFNIFALLVHEQVHFLGLRGRYGDLIANLLVGYPLLVLTVEGYAGVHLSHHQYYFTDKDPDHRRKSGEDWNFPMSSKRFARLFLSDLFGLTFIKLLKGKRLPNANIFKRPHPTPAWLRPAYYLAAAALLTYFGGWQIFLVYWIVPLITVFPVIVRLGAITEHIYNLPGAGVIESSPLVFQTWWEKLLLPNLNFALHPYHHFYTGVAYINLPKVHEIFARENLVNEKNIFHGYWSYLKYLQCSHGKVAAVTNP